MAFLGVLPESESFGTQLGRGLGAGVGAGLSQAQQFHQQMMLERQKAHSLAQQTKQLEKVKLMETGLGTIEKMRNLLSSAGGWTSNPKNKIAGLIPGETQKARGELESLGTSLIALRSAGVPIRNQKEFDKFSKVISDANSSPSEMEGALNGLEDILTRSIDAPEEHGESKKPKMKFSASNSEHRKKAEQLYKTYQDKEKVRTALSREFEF